MKHRWVVVLVLALLAASIFILAKPTLDGEPWRIKQGLDLAGGVRIVLQAQTDKLPAGEKWDPAKHLSSIIRIIRNRVDIQGVSEPLIQPKGRDQVIVELPDIKDKDKAIEQLKSTAQMEFRHFKNVHYASARKYRPVASKYTMEVIPGKDGKDHFIFTDAEGKEVPASKVIEESVLILTGNDLKPVSRAVKDQSTMGTVVALEFTREGRQKFAEFTRKNVGEILAIVLDGKILSAPTIDEPILTGEAIIRGKFTPREAALLAEFINAGALPVPLDVVQTQSVEATLGRASIAKSIHSGYWGLGAVVVFMMLYYLLPGLLADVALGIYAVLTLALFKLIGVTMTLPGIAAFILSIGMAVDANILIFERLKEELRSGKTLHAAIDAGFSRAFTSILDSNVCTIITCIILGWLGTGPIRGFALVLGLGVVVSMFTAITTTRTLLHLVVNLPFAQNPALFGLGRQWVTGGSNRQVDIVGRMKIWFALSLAILIPGLYFWLGAGGLHKGIDFTGGSLMQVDFRQPVVSTSPIEQLLSEAGLTGSMVQKSKDNPNTVFIRTKDLSEEQFKSIKDQLQTKLDGKVMSEERVGPAISRELTANAVKAVVLSAIMIVLYLSARFAIGGFMNGLRFGTCAILATLHDVGVIIGVFAMLGYFLNWEIDSLFVTALLTVIGFSTHDTIVIFDRIRENLRHRAKGEVFDSLVNKSILQSFARSINTSLTVVLTLVAMLVFGASNIKHFVWALLIGVITGTYSSIFNASQLLVLWQRIAEKRPASGRPVADVSLSRSTRALDLKPLDSSETESDPDEAAKARASDAGTVTGKTKSAKKAKKRRF